LDWSWSDGGVLPAQLVERRASITLAERAWEALADRALSSEALLRAVNVDGGHPVTLKTLKPVLSRSPRIESTATGWRRAGARLEIVRKRDNGGVSSEASGTDNGADNDAATPEREHDNETDNTRAPDRSVVVVPSVEGQPTTVGTSFAERFAAQQAEAWASLDSRA
jgi:hypothetical protein